MKALNTQIIISSKSAGDHVGLLISRHLLQRYLSCAWDKESGFKPNENRFQFAAEGPPVHKVRYHRIERDREVFFHFKGEQNSILKWALSLQT